MVEFLLGIVFLTLAMAELFTGGANIPGIERRGGFDFVSLVTESRWEVFRIYGWHCLLLTLCMGAGLMAYDRNHPPWLFVCFTFLVGLVCPLIWSDLLPVAGIHASIAPNMPPHYFTGGIGLMVGLLLGAISSWIYARFHSDGYMLAAPMVAVTIGLYCGWQLLAPMFTGAAIMAMIANLFTDSESTPSRAPFAIYMSLSAWACLLVWKPLNRMFDVWPDRNVVFQLGALAAFLLIVVAIALLRRQHIEPDTLEPDRQTEADSKTVESD